MRKLIVVLAAAACCGCFTWEGASEPGTKGVETFDLSAASAGLGKRVEVRGHGFVTHPESAVAFRMNGKVTAFDAAVAVAPARKERLVMLIAISDPPLII